MSVQIKGKLARDEALDNDDTDICVNFGTYKVREQQTNYSTLFIRLEIFLFVHKTLPYAIVSTIFQISYWGRLNGIKKILY